MKICGKINIFSILVKIILNKNAKICKLLTKNQM